MERTRFQLDLLDDEDPFEVDERNRAHFFKHDHYGYEDVFDVFASNPLYFPAKLEGEADWLMVAELPGEPPLVVPLAPSESGRLDKARPIGIYRASESLVSQYYEARRKEG